MLSYVLTSSTESLLDHCTTWLLHGDHVPHSPCNTSNFAHCFKSNKLGSTVMPARKPSWPHRSSPNPEASKCGPRKQRTPYLPGGSGRNDGCCCARHSDIATPPMTKRPRLQKAGSPWEECIPSLSQNGYGDGPSETSSRRRTSSITGCVRGPEESRGRTSAMTGHVSGARADHRKGLKGRATPQTGQESGAKVENRKTKSPPTNDHHAGRWRNMKVWRVV